MQDPSRRELHFDNLSADQDDLLESSLGFLRAILSYAKGVYILTGTNDPDSTGPILRSILELWADFKYLFQSGPQTESVARLRIWGTLVFLNRAPENPSAQAAADALKQSNPALYASVEGSHRSRPTGHYSGKGRKRLIVELCGEDFGRLYETLSWDVHPITQGLLDVSTEISHAGLQRRFTYRTDSSEVTSQACVLAIHILTDCWSQFVSTFGALGRPQARRSQA